MTEGITFSPSPFFYFIIGAIIGMIVGWVIGFFDSNNRTAKKIEVAEKNAEIKVEEAEKRIRMAEQKIANAMPATPPTSPGLLHLKHDHTLEMDGAAIEGVLTPERKKRLVELLTLIRPYLEGTAPPKPAPVQPQPIAPQPVIATPPVVAKPSAPVSRPVTPEPVAPVKPSLASAFTTQKKTEEKPAAPLSIVGQIDTILQSRLMNTPLDGKGISLHEAPDGSVEVIVGVQKYPSIDDVPNTEVQTAIRAAIAEWEQKFTPGL